MESITQSTPPGVRKPLLTPAGALARLVAFCAGALLVVMTFIVLLGVL